MESFLKVASMLRNATKIGVVLGTVVIAFAGIQGAAGASTQRSASAVLSAAAAPTPRLTKLVAEAKHQTTLGIPYLYAGGHGTNPAPLNSRVDCSGLVRELYHYAFGVDIGGGSGDGMIRLSGKFTRTSRPVPGDVVLLGNGGSAPAYHSGIYIGTVKGEAAMVGSPTTGQNIKVQQSRGGTWGGDLMGYWHYNGATAKDSGSQTAQPTPRVRGSLDAVSARVGGFSVAGWALDPQRMTGAATAQVLLDGRQVAAIGTSVVRSDVNRTFGTSGTHGFSAALSAGPGRHTVCINARPSGTSSVAVPLGCRAVTVPPTPTRGSFDRISGARGSFAAYGWAYDVWTPAASNPVRLTLDGRVAATVRPTGMRADVNRMFHLSGTHGFAARIAATPGRHTVCALSLPMTASSAAKNLGCRAVVVS